MAKSVIELKSFDELFGGHSAANADEVVYLPRKSLRSYKKHTFRVEDNETFAELVISVGEYGILEPLLVRKTGESGIYEIVAGHRRHRAAELNDLEEVPCIIKDMADARANVVMVDTNIHRSDDEISYSELAISYRLKKEAMEAEGSAGKTYEKLAKQVKMSRSRLHRYIRLTYLQPELLQLTDNKKLAFGAAVEISYLEQCDQELLLAFMKEKDILPSLIQAEQLHQAGENGGLNRHVISKILEPERKVKPVKITLRTDIIRKYFAEETEEKEIEQIIVGLLEQWRHGQEGKV